jgi:hypothetical protein
MRLHLPTGKSRTNHRRASRTQGVGFGSTACTQLEGKVSSCSQSVIGDLAISDSGSRRQVGMTAATPVCHNGNDTKSSNGSPKPKKIPGAMIPSGGRITDPPEHNPEHNPADAKTETGRREFLIA